MKCAVLLAVCAVFLVAPAHAVQPAATEAEGSACMGDTLSRKQAEQAALLDAKRRAIEFVSTRVMSETEVRNAQLERDLISSFANAEVKVLRELERKWYKDAASGDCFRVRISAEVRPVPAAGEIAGYTPWMSATEYQEEFERRFRLGMYPEQVEGRNRGGTSEFRAAYVQFLPGRFYFWSHHGIDKSAYDKKHQDLTGQGYRLKSIQTFVDAKGVQRYQATWVKDD